MTNKTELQTAQSHTLEVIFALEPLPFPSQEQFGLEAAWLRTPGFPMHSELKPVWAEALCGIADKMQTLRSDPLLLETYLQMNLLERPNGARMISRNGPKWMPSLCYGLWPDREPPRPLSKEDFSNMIPGEPMREAYFHLMRLSTPNHPVRLEAARSMAGSGALLLTLGTAETADEERRALSERIKELVMIEELRNYPSYFPLLDASSLQRLSPETLDRCLTGVEFYLREDPLERAALVISRVRLRELFPELAVTRGDAS